MNTDIPVVLATCLQCHQPPNVLLLYHPKLNLLSSLLCCVREP